MKVSVSLFFVFLVGLFMHEVLAQSDESVLFTVDGHPVTVGEFRYIYEKTNAEQSDYSKQSVDDYLELYANFKLKIAEAKELGLHEKEALITELAGYKKQLSNNYLLDKEVLEKLAYEAYLRMDKDVKLSHIMMTIPARGRGDTTSAYKRISEAYDMLENGATFEEVAMKYSTDQRTKSKGGELGWRVAMFPEGFYNVESAAYDLKPGEYSKPVRSSIAYHIIKLEEQRPARGEIRIAQIFLKDAGSGALMTPAKEKIDSIYQLLIFGGDFEALAKQFSEDNKTKNNGGEIEKFGIGKYVESFEDEVFGLKEDGAFTAPFKTSKGWHIVKRLEKEEREPFINEKKLMMAKIKRNERYEIAEDALIEKIKTSVNFEDYNADVPEVRYIMGQDVFAGQWVPSDNIQEVDLFSFAGKTYTTKDFAEFLSRNKPFRFKYGLENDKSKGFANMLEGYEEKLLLDYEESQLEEKYPEFRDLMREYREGIMLFEIQKERVWDKAIEDTAQLRAFYLANKNDFLATPLIDVEQVMVSTQDPALLAKVIKQLKKKPVSTVESKFNKATQVISSTPETMDLNMVTDKGWQPIEGYVSEPENLEDGRTLLIKVIKVHPGLPKSFENARGAVIVDYQNQLEAEWIAMLKTKHVIEVDKEVLQQLYK